MGALIQAEIESLVALALERIGKLAPVKGPGLIRFPGGKEQKPKGHQQSSDFQTVWLNPARAGASNTLSGYKRETPKLCQRKACHMRSTHDLIAELEAEARQHHHVALIVGLGNSTIPILSTDENRLQLLNDAVELGGHPLGLIALYQTSRKYRFMTRVCQEHTGNAAKIVQLCLDRIAEEMGDTLTRLPSRDRGAASGKRRGFLLDPVISSDLGPSRPKVVSAKRIRPSRAAGSHRKRRSPR